MPVSSPQMAPAQNAYLGEKFYGSTAWFKPLNFFDLLDFHDFDHSTLLETNMCQGLNFHYFHIIGDGHQPNSRGLYTHYKDSLLKVG